MIADNLNRINIIIRLSEHLFLQYHLRVFVVSIAETSNIFKCRFFNLVKPFFVAFKNN